MLNTVCVTRLKCNVTEGSLLLVMQLRTISSSTKSACSHTYTTYTHDYYSDYLGHSLEICPSNTTKTTTTHHVHDYFRIDFLQQNYFKKTFWCLFLYLPCSTTKNVATNVTTATISLFMVGYVAFDGTALPVWVLRTFFGEN